MPVLVLKVYFVPMCRIIYGCKIKYDTQYLKLAFYFIQTALTRVSNYCIFSDFFFFFFGL